MSDARLVTRSTEGVTFSVSDVEWAAKPLEEAPYREAVAKILGARPEAWPPGAPKLVPVGPGNALVATLLKAFQEHRPIALSPDVVWLTLLRGFGVHVNEHAGALRGRFVRHEGKQRLSVRRDTFALGAPHNDWAGVLEELSEQLRGHVGPLVDEVVPDFSTTDALSRAASQISLVSALQGYFDVRVHTLCGIPQVTLRGTPEDWRGVQRRFEALASYDLEWWAEAVRPVLAELVRSAEGEVDRELWRSLIKVEDASGGAWVTGWVVKLFPYLLGRGVPGDWDRPEGYIRNPHLHGIEGHPPTLSSFPEGPGEMPFTWDFLGTELPMAFVGGVFGARQTPGTRVLEPAIGWAVRHVDAARPERRVAPGGFCARLPRSAFVGVGSLPWTDPRQAIDVVAEYAPNLPFWPQLPARAPGEDMVSQALGAAAQILPPREGWPWPVPDPVALLAALVPELRPEDAAGFFAFKQALDEGRFPKAEALKGQLVGPWTLASSLGRPELLEPLAEHLAALARWQLLRLQRFCLPVLIMVDEPALGSVPAGERERAAAAIGRVFRELDEHEGISGLHCCGAFDLTWLDHLTPDVLHLDLSGGVEAFLEHPSARRWRAGGGRSVLGVLPSSGPLPSKDSLVALRRRLWERAWKQGDDLVDLWSTACGLAQVNTRRAEEMLIKLRSLLPRV